jgi:hypothetical protein
MVAEKVTCSKEINATGSRVSLSVYTANVLKVFVPDIDLSETDTK